MMRKLFFGLLTALILAACSSDPVYHGMTPQQKENYSKAIAGEYTGTYVILYNDGGGDDKAVKIKNSQMTITDQTMHSVCFHDYPVSQLSGVVADSALAKALASAPNVDFLADYRFYDLQDNGDTHWGFEPAAIPLTLHYGGADHHLVLKLNSQTYFLMSKASLDASKPFANQSVFQFTVDGIYEGHTQLQAFDDWQDNSAEYLTYFQLE
ncbi:MAG: membrane lipoprotein lipid attachment site-containing protein [Prevotella sp.]|nr:membrane lipoprotein lipid attachment site-containing protein [Prevotella sp.]